MFDELLREPSRWFRTRLRGYDRRQVDEELAALDEELQIARTDRDAALARAEDVTRQLEEARAELSDYRLLHAGYSKDNAVGGCMRYLIHVAKQEAESVTERAREAANTMERQAEQVLAQRVSLLDEAEQESQRRLAVATRQAREIVGAALDESKRLLADLAARQRVLDDWYEQTAAAVNLPTPRQEEQVADSPEQNVVSS
jgi:cell division septum initiation protein DivIVA